MRPSTRDIRIAAALIVAVGIAAGALSILADALGVGAAEGTFGWKRVTLLAVGVAVAAIGALLVARPHIVDRLGLWPARTAVREPPRSRVSWERARRRAAGLPLLSNRYFGYLAIGLLALLAIALVWTRLLRIEESMWHDEAFTVLNYSGVGPGAILLGQSDFVPNNHVLYNLLSWFTASLLGESDAIYRLWSVVPGIAAIAIGAWWAWARIGPVASIAFAAIAVAGPLHLEYTTQARGYGLALLAAVLLLIAADHLTRAYSKWALAGFVAAGLVGIWTLYVFAVAFVGQALALLSWPRLRIPVIVAVGAAGILSIAWYAPVLGEVTGTEVSGETISLAQAASLYRPLELLVTPTVTLVTGEGAQGTITLGAVALLMLGLVGLWRRGLGGLALILVVPPLFFNLALSLGDVTTVGRHQVFLIPYVVIPVAAGIAELGRLAARYPVTKAAAAAAGAAAVVVLSGAIVQEQENRDLPYENFKGVARVVERTGIDLVITDSRKPDGLRYYLPKRVLRLPDEWIDSLLCEPRRELVFIHHIGGDPHSSARRLRCLARKPGIRIRVPQQERGRAIDVWIVDPRTSRETVEDDLSYVPER